MNRTSFSLEIFGDRLPWVYQDLSSGDNNRQLEYLKMALNSAMENELTERQRQTVEAFYFDNKNITQIAKEEGLCKSTVSRHLKRARQKLKNSLKYSFLPLWYSED